jgi:hypothetical protein
MSKLETTLVGICNAEHSETSPGKFEGTETLTKHVYFVNDLSVELAKKAFIARFLKRIPLDQLEKLVNFKMEDVAIEGQYLEASKFSAKIEIEEDHVLLSILASGFDSYEDFNKLVAGANLSTPKARTAFEWWKDLDGTKDGLLKLQ